MMSVNELHYLVAALGVGMFVTSILCTLFNHVGRFPYKWYILLLGFAAMTFVANVPYFDNVCMEHRPLRIARDLFNQAIIPVAMLCVCRFARIDVFRTVITQIGVCVAIVGMELCFYGFVGRGVGSFMLLTFIFFMGIWTYVTMHGFLDSKGVKYLKKRERRWLAFFVVAVACFSILLLSIRVLLPFVHIENMTLVNDAAVFFPMLIFFQLHLGNLVFGQNNTPKA